MNIKWLSSYRFAGGYVIRFGSFYGGFFFFGIYVWRAFLFSGIIFFVFVIFGRGFAGGYFFRGWFSGRRVSVGGRIVTRLVFVWRFVYIVWRTFIVFLRVYILNNFWGKYFMKYKYCIYGFYVNILKVNNVFCIFLLVFLESGLFK